jgi:hypothetical protein
MTLLEPDRGQIERFVTCIFRHAGAEGWVSIRAFSDDAKPSRIQGVPLAAGLDYLINVAEDIARRAANDPKKIVFTPPARRLRQRGKGKGEGLDRRFGALGRL